MINKFEIKQKQEIKYLGVLIVNTLTWKAHIKLVCTKLARGCFALIKLRNLVNLSTLKSVYYSMVYTHLQYCIAVWGHACKIAVNPLEKMHKKIAKIMVKASFTDPSLPTFHKLNILKLADIYKLEIAKLTHRVKQHVDKSQFSCFKPVSSLVSSQHNYNTRHSANKNYLLPTVRTNFGKRAFEFMGPKIWQEVPSEFKSARSKNVTNHT